MTDDGPQFACETFQQFLQNCSVHDRTSSPKYPQSNSEAERAVQTAKRLLKSTTNLQNALLSYRSTPKASGVSPAELLYSRKVRNALPATPDTLNQPGPTWTSSARASARTRKTNSSNTTSPTLTVSKKCQDTPNLQAKYTKGASAISSSKPRKNATKDANMFGWCLLSGSYECYPLDLPLPLLYPGHSKRGAKHRGSQRWPKLSIDHDLYC